MKATGVLAVAMLLVALALTGVAHAVNMFAGPLFPSADDDFCLCQIVNVTTSAKTTQVILMSSTGVVRVNSGTISIPAGQSVYVGPGNEFEQQYCKFVNASPTNFRAAITCFGTPNNSDNVALPAR